MATSNENSEYTKLLDKKNLSEEERKKYKEEEEDRANKHLPGWQYNWTPSVIADIKRKYSKLVMPYINGDLFVRPPIVRIKLFSTENELPKDARDQILKTLMKILLLVICLPILVMQKTKAILHWKLLVI